MVVCVVPYIIIYEIPGPYGELLVRQEAWRHSIEKLLSNLPEVDEDDAASEDARERALINMRVSIAKRWLYIKSLKDQVSSSHLAMVVGKMKEFLNSLIEIHGPEIAFSPMPPEHLFVPLNDDDVKSTVLALHRGKSDEGLSSSSVSSKRSHVLPHSFKFLHIVGQNQNDVWSCVQASGRKLGRTTNLFEYSKYSNI